MIKKFQLIILKIKTNLSCFHITAISQIINVKKEYHAGLAYKTNGC